jgi:iron complex transport system permease protein
VANAPKSKSKSRTLLVLSISIGILVAVILLSMAAGPRWLSLAEILEMCTNGLIAKPESGFAVIWQHRVPRVILSSIVGASLAVSGLAIQTAVRNPLADPYVLGVSSGACTGAVLLLLGGSHLFGGSALFAAAFCGGLLTSIAVYLLARHRGTLSPHRLILSGVAVTYMLTAVTSFCLLLIDRNNFGGTNNFLFWAMGSFARSRWDDLFLPLSMLFICTTALALQSRVLDVLNMNDESALALGVRPDIVRLGLFFLISLMVASSVAACGQVGFVGLVVPHISRRLLGCSHRHSLPLAAIIGASFLTLADAVARTIASPQEIPVGVITAGCGAPFFIALLRTRGGGVGQ